MAKNKITDVVKGMVGLLVLVIVLKSCLSGPRTKEEIAAQEVADEARKVAVAVAIRQAEEKAAACALDLKCAAEKYIDLASSKCSSAVILGAKYGHEWSTGNFPDRNIFDNYK